MNCRPGPVAMDRRKRARYDCVATFGAVRMARLGYLDPCICIVVRCSVEKRVTVLHDDFSSFRSVDPAGNRNPLAEPHPHQAVRRHHPVDRLHHRRLRRLGLAVRRLQLAVLAHHPPRLRDLRQHGAAAGGGEAAPAGDSLPRECRPPGPACTGPRFDHRRPRQGELCRRRAAPRLSDGRSGRCHRRQGGSRLRRLRRDREDHRRPDRRRGEAGGRRRCRPAGAGQDRKGRLQPSGGAWDRRHAPGGSLRRRPAERSRPCRDGGTRQCAAHPFRRGGENA